MTTKKNRFVWFIMVLGTSHIGYSKKVGQFMSQGLRSHFSSLQHIKKEHGITKPVFRYAAQFGEQTAVQDQYGSYKYASLLMSSNRLATEITKSLDQKIQERVAFLCPNSAVYVITQWACWVSGNIAVPLSHHHPLNMLEYYVKDCDANLLITTEERAPLMQELASRTNRKLLVLDKSYSFDAMEKEHSDSENKLKSQNSTYLESIGKVPEFYSKSDAMILYTSGSTGKPKGVVLSHNNLLAQVSSLVEMWQWNARDVILHALPLSHIHGVVNALMCPLAVGAKCVMLPLFSAKTVWSYLLGRIGKPNEQVNIFMGVPTMYVQLLNEYDRSYKKTERMVEYVKAVCSNKVRLMVSGSAPLPEMVFDRWKHVTGHDILERYGMTEIGMALSNPLRGERKRGFVGNPLPGVKVRIVHEEPVNKFSIVVEGDSRGSRIINKNLTTGNLQVQGETVFKRYWGKPEETAKEFADGNWFKTGDVAEYINGSYRILGRSSVDIIKSGGYKISALQIESVIIDHPAVDDVAVVGIPDITWGQKIAAVVKLKDGKTLNLRVVQHWVKEKLPIFMMPAVLKVVNEIPRNAMGKVNKKDIAIELFSSKLR